MKYKKIICLLLLVITILTACLSRNELISYYAEKENYINATGTVVFINYTDDALYIAFEDMSYEFDDINFEIEGKSYEVVKDNGIENKLKLGNEIEFITAPRYFGDGYAMPIVSITVEGEVLLEFEKGYDNLLEWIGRKRFH